MSQVVGTVFSSRDFTYHKESKRFVSEISTVSECLRFLYHDDMKVGFGIQSAKTGRTVYFTLADIETNTEGETVCWMFEVVNPDFNASLIGVCAVVVNT